jgi:putative ABC transport system substrate-binding protein
MILRRSFLTLLGGAAAAWPVGAWAQQAGRKPLIGVLMPYPANDLEGKARVAAFRQELNRLGWSDDNARYDERWAGSDDADRVRASAMELMTAEPNVILSMLLGPWLLYKKLHNLSQSYSWASPIR